MALLVGVPLVAQVKEKPNVVVIMADDIGLGDISFYHRERTGKEALVPTPHIDQLINEGMRFSDAHSPASLCAPTRFSMMTGNYSYRNMRPWGVWGTNVDALIEPDFTTVGRLAQAGGYHTAFFGKWGLGGVWKTKNKKVIDYTREEQGPQYFGFNYSLSLPQGIQDPPYIFYENKQWMKIKPDSELKHIPVEQTGYGGDGPESRKPRDRSGIGDSNWDPTLAGSILAGKAVEYIQRQVSDDQKQSFYLYYCSQAVHVPHTPPEELDGQKVAGLTLGAHGDMIVEFDVQVGMIVKALKKAGVYRNTLLILTSDNGGLDYNPVLKKAGHQSSNVLKGKKGSISEGGHRVPFIAVWPNKIKPNTVSDVPVVSHDTVATIATLAGQPIDRTVVKDSANLLPILLGREDATLKRNITHRGENGPSYAIREGDWKLVMQGNFGSKNTKTNNFKKIYDGTLPEIKPVELYNLKDNLSEDSSQNLVDNPEYASLVKRLMTTYKRLRQTGEPTVMD